MSALVADDVVFLNPDTDSYVALDRIGRRVWEQLATPCRVGHLVAALSAEFAGPAATIAADVTAFLTELEREGMVTLTVDRVRP